MIVHRDYQDSGVSIIKIFDKRIEFFNSGKLYGDLTVGQLLSGQYSSIPRNSPIANTFKEAGIIERYGSGIAHICNICLDYGIPMPIFEEFQHGFRVTIYKNGIDKNYVECVNGGVAEFLNFITNTPGLNAHQLAIQLNQPQRTLERWLKQLKEAQKIEYRGSSKTGGYYAK